MHPMKPVLLLRARARPEARERFGRWFCETHIEDVRRIPGIEQVESGSTADGTRLGLYTFAGADAVQPALGSPEAAYARGTWNQWTSDLEELIVEVYAPLFPLPVYQSIN